MKRKMLSSADMTLVIIWLGLFHTSSSYSMNTDSYENNNLGLTSLHDAIIFSDIADIMHEFENSMNSQLSQSHVFSESDSEEDIENLLSGYQYYLDKAHKQRINYIEKNKGKNKVPLFRRDKYAKLNPMHQNNYNEKFDIITKTKPLSLHNLNTLMPQGSDLLQNNSGESMSVGTKSFLLNLPPLWPKSTKSIDSSCYCKDNQIPCKCACKQCLIAFSPLSSQFKRNGKMQKSMDETISDFEHGIEQSKNNVVNNNLNIILKIALQIHNISNADDDLPSGDEYISKINLPLPYLKFPTLFELAKYKNSFLNYNHPSPLHKITIHKRKKSRMNNNNKKHKSKKVIASRIYKDEPDMQVKDNDKSDTNELMKNITIYNKAYTQAKLTSSVTESVDIHLNFLHNNNTTETSERNKILTFDSNILPNISKQDNGTNEIQKIDNSIEADSEKIVNITTIGTIRLKRDLSANNMSILSHTNNNIKRVNESRVVLQNYTSNTTKQLQKFDKMLDSELLYWPKGNESNSSERSARNKTESILDKVMKRTKLNLTHDMIRANRTAALERAIFGNVDWNDTDEVVSIFMSFVGKYMRGILSFCSGNICHSIKCINKVCIHRICTPEHRYNKNGHCMGNDNNDIVTTMQSAMDLPSNITFEVVDILQNRMLGKLYGKISLCINAKCTTFAASKKMFYKLNCTSKTLNATGHCPNKTKLKNIQSLRDGITKQETV